MQSIDAEVSGGVVRLWGEFESFRPDRPLLLVVRGAFPALNQLDGLIEKFPEVDVVLTHLPGMHSPFLPENNLWAFAKAFDEMLSGTFPERPVDVLGLSMGGVAALAMRSGQVRSIIACDPPLSTEGLWPMREMLRESSKSPAGGAWVWGVFGVSPAEIVDRDHRGALDGVRAPTLVLLGEDPLEPERPVERMPSLVSEAERELFRGHPRIRTRVVQGAGHNIPADGTAVLLAGLRQALAR